MHGENNMNETQNHHSNITKCVQRPTPFYVYIIAKTVQLHET